MGMNVQSILGMDPEALDYRLRSQEVDSFSAPYRTTGERGGALVGGILGRGIANLFNDRGFFDVADPGLRAVSNINKIASGILADIDPSKPEDLVKGYTQLAKQLAGAGYTQPAFLAAQEASKLQATIGAGFKESSTYMTKDGTPALYKNGRYYDANNNILDPKDLQIIPKDSLGRIINTATAGGTGKPGETQAEKAARALAERQAKQKAAAATATADPLAPKWDDDAKTAAAKAQARAERDAQRAMELSNMGGIGTEMVAP